MRTIKKIHKPEYSPINDLITYRVLPIRGLSYIDPFLFLNHHGPQEYGPFNNGLPFGPHPHRGMETVTFILDGDISHKDNSGHESIIRAGGVQWMTAGKGLIHAEVSSDEFKERGGKLEILQLWINLPAKLKMTSPFYSGLEKEKIPVATFDDGKVTMQLIAGEEKGVHAAFSTHIDLTLRLIKFKPGSKVSLKIPTDHNIFFYVIEGSLQVNEQQIQKLSLVQFNNDSAEINIVCGDNNSTLLLGHALPINEPVVSGGPFVMNSEDEIQQAYIDYQNGKFGQWAL